MLQTLAIIYVVASLLTTLFLVRSPHFDRAQKLFQAGVVWVLPVIGSVVVLVFHSVVYRNMKTRLEPDQPNPNRKDDFPGDAFFD